MVYRFRDAAAQSAATRKPAVAKAKSKKARGCFVKSATRKIPMLAERIVPAAEANMTGTTKVFGFKSGLV
jgi:hypothetical protein